MKKNITCTSTIPSILRWAFVFLLVSGGASASAANRYWVSSAASSWNNTASWSDASGGAGGASIPTASDVVVFDGAAGTNGACTLDAAVNILGLSMTSGFSGSITQETFSMTIGNTGAILSGGSFTGGSGSINVKGVFTLSGTNFTSTSGTLTLAQGVNFNLLSGNFIHNNGTVLFNVANNSLTGNIIFNHLTIHNSFGPYVFNISSGSTIIANGNLTLSGIAATWINTGTIEAKGNIVLANLSGDGGGTATLLINGTGTQTITGSANDMAGKLPMVTINKSSGILNLSGKIRVGNNWTYIAGTINAGTSRMQFSGTFTISGTQTFNDVEFNAVNGSAYITIASNSLLTANGNVYLSGSSDVTINTGTLEVQGNLTVTNTSLYSGGNATFLINGTGNQTLTGQGSSNIGRLPKVTIAKPSGTLYLASIISVANNWTYISGTLNPGTSRVVFSGDLAISGTQTLNEVDFSSVNFNGGSWFAMSSGTVITVMGTTFISGPATVRINTGTVEAKGDITITNSSAWSDNGSATLLINGTGNQTFSSSAIAGQGRLPNIKINKPSGTLNMAGIITVTGDWTYLNGTVNAGTSTINFLNQTNINAQGNNTTMMFYNVMLGDSYPHTLLGNINISNVLSLDAGKIKLNGHTCYMSFNSPAAITRNTGYIVSESTGNDGKISWNIGSATGAYVYPFATVSGTYIPFRFVLTGGDAGTVSVATYPTGQNNTPYPVSPDAVTNMKWSSIANNSSSVIDRFWQIDKTGGSGTANVTYSYTPSEVTADAIGQQSYLRAQRYDVATNSWENPRGGQTSDAASYSVTESAITRFSPRILAVVDYTVLPVKLIGFSARAKNGIVEINWSTATEINNDYFIVERSADARAFKQVATIKGAGNSTGILTYSVLDAKPLSRTSYYRLKQADMNGKLTYSKVAMVYIEPHPLVVFNNPVRNGSLEIRLPDANGFIQIFNGEGRKVYQKRYANTTYLSIPVNAWSKGVYTILLHNNTGRFVIE